VANYNLDGSFSLTAAFAATGQRRSLVDSAVATAAAISTNLNHTISLSTVIAAAATITPTTQADLGLTTSQRFTAAIAPALYPPIDSFTATLDLTAIIADYTDTDLLPDRQPISCTVTFTPRLRTGQIIWIPGMGLALAPIKARCDTDGVLRTIVGGNGVQLIANTPILGMDQLIYDVTFTNVVYNRSIQSIEPFAFEAPTTAGAVLDLSRADKLTPKPPNWYPTN
jgi:hypothetical protein